MVRQKTLKDKTMKALIRYLRVEGKIKVGDVVNDNGLIVGVQYKGDYAKGAFKVKLFAVTQNIKVGDEIYFPFFKNSHQRVSKIENGMVWVGRGKISPNTTGNAGMSISGCYKIFGEVSPKAKFVEDKKEYEILSGVSMGGQKYLIKKSGFILIKCPCCGDFK